MSDYRKISKPELPARKNRDQVKRVLIVDDHPMMRQGLAQLINDEPDLKVSGQAESASQAMSALAGGKVDLVLLDISLPDKDGLEVIKDMRVLHPGLPVLVLSMYDESLYAERVLRAGARGYVMKQEGAAKLLRAVRVVLGGQIAVSESMSSRLLEHLAGSRPKSSPIERLSDREFEVFQMIGRGHGTREIAEHLHLSIKTVEVHRAHIKQKLELKTATELVRYAVRWVESQGRA